MKIVENFFNALLISIVVAIVLLGTLFTVKGGHVEISERTAASNVTKPLMAMLDVNKEHHMFANDYVIIDISYNK